MRLALLSSAHTDAGIAKPSTTVSYYIKSFVNDQDLYTNMYILDTRLASVIWPPQRHSIVSSYWISVNHGLKW